jgi:hypothetical protein
MKRILKKGLVEGLKVRNVPTKLRKKGMQLSKDEADDIDFPRRPTGSW